ncbi:hypothetical protein CJ030_MR5G001035 [Morella rubra]|uniref:Uncharacterized protein n=1 Tax=Morella rubra TaxID=262757 RepID=A0A6A1VI95_9ROSI|nr:hypothetical protein CJ030_MR5G001035 [Morella rubra]
MDHSERSITNVGRQTATSLGGRFFSGAEGECSGDSGADAFVVHGAPMPLDGLENKFALMDRALTEEMNIM